MCFSRPSKNPITTLLKNKERQGLGHYPDAEGARGEGRGESCEREGETRQQVTHAGDLVTHKPSADTILHFD